MIGPKLVNALRVGLVLVVALAAAVVANVVLLGIASGPRDPVGRLSPRAGLVRLPAATTTSPAVPPVATTPRQRRERGSREQDD